MKFKKTFLSFVSLNLVLGLVSCNPSSTLDSDSFKTSESEGSKVFHKKDIKLNNNSIEYQIPDTTMTTYFAEGSDIPYISVREFIDTLTGYYIKDACKFDFDKDNNTLNLSTPTLSNFYCSIDCTNDVIKTNNMNFFFFINAPEGIDYGSHFIYSGMVTHKGKPVLTLDLKPYNFNTFSVDGEVYLPLSVYNNVFLKNNIASLFYNGIEYYFYGHYLSDNKDIYDMRNKSLEGKKISSELLSLRFDELCFILDYFYGLKDHNNISDYRSYIKSMPDIYNKLMSNDAKVFEDGMLDLLMTTFDDPHTNTGYKSFYSEVSSEDEVRTTIEWSRYGDRSYNIYKRYYDLLRAYDNTFPESKIVRFEGNTAFVKFNEFSVGRNEEIYNNDGSIKEDAWKYDTFLLMKKALDDCKKNKDIKNVVLDLSTNGGGAIAAIYSSLGFLTDEDVYTTEYDLLSKEESIITYKVDTDLDGDYEDKDSYSNFNFYILSSNYTFSAANDFTSISKDMGIATIIGEKSGGGMCGVSQANLCDGTTFTHSGNLGSVGFEIIDNDFKTKDIEDGVSCDYSVPLEKFYDLKYLNEQINNGFKN